MFEKFQQKDPELSKVVTQNPGRSVRASYVRSQAAQRVASGLGGKGEQQRLSTFHQGGPSSSGESQEEDQKPKEKEEVTSEPHYNQDLDQPAGAEEVTVTEIEASEYHSVDETHKATTRYYSSDEDQEP